MEAILEILFRWIFALQMLFWGWNGFFNWVKIPPSSEKLDHFVNACIEVKFIMPIVKVLEIALSLCLLANIFVVPSLLAFLPIMFVITGLHIFWNARPYMVLLTCSLPYFILLILHSSKILNLLHN